MIYVYQAGIIIHSIKFLKGLRGGENLLNRHGAIVSNMNHVQIGDHLMLYMDSNDRLIVVLSGQLAVWNRAIADNQWVKDNMKQHFDENQVVAWEKAKEGNQAHGEIEIYRPGFLVAQDTYCVGYIKGVGHIYHQTVIIGFAMLYDRKNALVAADMLNDRVVSFFEQHDLKLMRILMDRGTEYCGNRENMSMNCIWQWKTLIIPRLRRKARS